MKFEKIIMKNFMRYQGVNEICFSLDKEKNVTIVLGDNTVGKTTIAQAFRWGMYGTLLTAKGKTEADYTLLNQNILEKMRESSKESVSVDIVLCDDIKKYHIHRQVTYKRKVPLMVLQECGKDVRLFISDMELGDYWEEVGASEPITKKQEMVRSIINELMPDKLSHYFLFDGEKWSDFEHNGTKENIKESVHTLTGLSSMRTAMYHIKGMNANSVIGKFRKNVVGTGEVYDEIQRDLEKEEHKIEKWKQEQKTIQNNIINHEKKYKEIEDYLIENQNTEALQKELSIQRVAIQSKRNRAKDSYKTFVQEFSSRAYLLAAKPMIQTALNLMQNVNMERKDVPYMKQATIDYLLERGTCICGHVIGEEEKKCLMEQREYLPPADIGSLLGEFEKTAKRWTIKNEDYYKELKEQAAAVSACAIDLEEAENHLMHLEQKMDENIDFKEYRSQLKFHKGEILSLDREIGILKNKVESSYNTIKLKEQQLNSFAVRNQENEKWKFRMELAKEVYERLEKEYQSKENKVFLELNKRLQENFNQMFNAHDKKIELDKNYNIRMFYKTELGYREEKNLSEGEKVARNFAFIVTMMEFNKKQKAEGNQFSDTLPIVLDGPFSKLGDENIQLIAKCLPNIAEQVIIFMLEKDWKYTGLDKYVGAKYQIEKESEASYAKICLCEV